ncbi:MAG: TrkH family potassium uptake protein [Planctomycetota bacterium]|nr:TrkH family potassium uptake protein [Planctomycetota bacterium]
MNKRVVLRTLGIVLLILASVMLVPTLVSVICGQSGEQTAFLWTIGATGLAGLGLFVGLRRHKAPLTTVDGFGVVGFSWILCSAFGALPFFFAGLGLSYTDAFFEAVSGFTTTGATVIGKTASLPNGVESLPPGIGLWRCMTQWLGGMGIVVLVVAVLPMMGAGGYQVFKAEAPGPMKDRFTPRIRDTAMTLWKIYVLLSVLQVLALVLTGMSLYEAVCHAFTTVSTGGFSTRNSSVGAYPPVVQWIVAVFMLAAGMNFTAHYRLVFQKDWGVHGRSEEIRWMVTLTVLAAAFLMFHVCGRDFMVGDGTVERFGNIEAAARASFFTATSVMTTTGYCNADFDAWPAACRILLLIAMVVGGCAGSTAGGFKVARLLIVLKGAWREIKLLFQPRAVYLVKMDGKPVDAAVQANVAAFFALTAVILALSSAIMAVILQTAGYHWSPAGGSANMGSESLLLTAVSSVFSAFGNVGPGLAGVGPYQDYASIPDLGKWLLTFLMLLGRLEIYGILTLFLPGAWRK